MSGSTSDERLTELELRFTHLQKVMEDLSDVALAQSQQMQKMERQLERLSERTNELSHQLDEPRNAEDERPPHY